MLIVGTLEKAWEVRVYDIVFTMMQTGFQDQHAIHLQFRGPNITNWKRREQVVQLGAGKPYLSNRSVKLPHALTSSSVR